MGMVKVALPFGIGTPESKRGSYRQALFEAGIEPVENVATLDGLDGLLLAGGTDVDPALYGESRLPETDEPDPVRDALESGLLREALARDLPVFGICRGLQLFNALLGGTLVQHVEGHKCPKQPEVHPVAIAPASRLASILSVTVYVVNSRHHQCAGKVAASLRVAATAPDGVIEALELPGKRFALAVQWHPEARPDGPDRKLFEAFRSAMQPTRRDFLALCALPTLAGRPGLIDGIERSIIWNGRDGAFTWFHPRACRIPGEPNPAVLMTCQSISGSDYYGQVHWSESKDLGATWSAPQPIAAMGRKRHPDGIEEGVCDVVPEYHPRTRTVLALGHNVYYLNGKLTRPNEQRWPVYVVRSQSGEWSGLRRLEWDNPDAGALYTSNCSQRVTLANGDILVPLSFAPLGRKDRLVTTARCAFDGREVKIRQSGNVLRLAVGRGLLEPSLTLFRGRYYMTIRAEDGCGYVTASRDGLQWGEQRPWCWEDGEPLVMSTTQQRWLTHSGGLFLVYTRKAKENVNVMRWRAPLYLAQADPEKLCLLRESEQIVFPLVGDGVRDSDHVPRMGNFHTTAVTERLSLVSVAEETPASKWHGNTLLARIHWRQQHN